MLYSVRLSNYRSQRLDDTLEFAFQELKLKEGVDFRWVYSLSDFLSTLEEEGEKNYIFALDLPENGYSPEWSEFMAFLTGKEELLSGCRGSLIVDGRGELFTKDVARHLIFACNRAGMRFPGKPLVEATGSLYNFNTIAMIKGVDNKSAYREGAAELISRLMNKAPSPEKIKNLVALHASSRETSNSLSLWGLVKENLPREIVTEEISIRNGEIVDCRGCSFEACRHFGEKGDCFYGGLMVDKVYPAILNCDALVLICPNYNDAVGANMMAMFNRLTALFYNNDFSSKEIYAIIVSGYSGGDILAQQIIGSMNLNKGFNLPPNFALMATANDPGSVLRIKDIGEEAREFANRIAE